MEYILSAEHINKYYKNRKILDELSINIKKGTIYGLIGSNGAGKTTLIRIISGIIKDKNMHFLGKYKKGNIGAIINSPALYENLSAEENLKIYCYLLEINSKEYIKKTLQTVGLLNNSKQKVKEFSLGMKQRLSIGIAIISDPELLILDEPINGLDPEGIAEFREMIISLNKNKNMTILISSHILSELSTIVKTIGVLKNGKIIKEDNIENIRNTGKNLEEYYMNLMRGK